MPKVHTKDLVLTLKGSHGVIVIADGAELSEVEWGQAKQRRAVTERLKDGTISVDDDTVKVEIEAPKAEPAPERAKPKRRRKSEKDDAEPQWREG